MADIIKVVRVMNLDVQYVNGEKTLVPRFRIEREREVKTTIFNMIATARDKWLSESDFPK